MKFNIKKGKSCVIGQLIGLPNLSVLYSKNAFSAKVLFQGVNEGQIKKVWFKCNKNRYVFNRVNSTDTASEEFCSDLVLPNGLNIFSLIVKLQDGRNHIVKWGFCYVLSEKNNVTYEHEQPLCEVTVSPLVTPVFIVNTPQYDVLFCLPGLNQTIGGVHAVIAICNALVSNKINASCILVGDYNAESFSNYKEPIFFNFIYAKSYNEVVENANIAAKILVSTIYDSARPIADLARKINSKHVQFIQGYEVYFDNGRAFSHAKESYLYGDAFIVTSKWLEVMLKRHVALEKVTRLPISVNKNIFYNRSSLKTNIGFVLRSAADKGQWIVLEIVDRLIQEGCNNISILKSSEYFLPQDWLNKVTVVDLPLGQVSLAQHLSRMMVFVDASLHEGFGLMPLEALACGCWVICSDSGGINEYLMEGVNGNIIKQVNKPEYYVERILDIVKTTVSVPETHFANDEPFSNFVNYFKSLL